ncbi:hypothetical protein VPH35_061883 [Triticum aestivum]
MLCPDWHSYCEKDDEDSFGIFIRDGSGDFAGKKVVFDMFWTDAPGLCVLCWKWACNRSQGVQGGTWQEVMLRRGGGGGAGNFAVHGVEEVINCGHGVEAAPDIICTRGVVLSDGEAQMLGLVITIEDGYTLDHILCTASRPRTSQASLWKIPNKIVQPVNLAPKGVIGGVFVAQNYLQVDDAVIFNLKQSNAQGINITCIVIGLRPAQGYKFLC